MKELEQKADELVSKHLPFARTWDCYWDEPSGEKNEIKLAIQSVNHTIEELKRMYALDMGILKMINEQIELKKILEGRLQL